MTTQQGNGEMMLLHGGYGQLWRDLKTKVKRTTLKLSPARPEFIAPGTLNAWFQFQGNKLVVCDAENVKCYDLWNLEERSSVSLKFSSKGIPGSGGGNGYDPVGGEWTAPPESFEFVGDVAMSKSKVTSSDSGGGFGEPQSSIVIWHIPTGRRLRTFQSLHSRGGWISDLHMDPHKIVVGVNQDTRNTGVKVLDLETGLTINTVRLPSNSPVDHLRFDSSRLVVSCREGILVWDMRTNGGLGEERNRPIIRLPSPKHQLSDLQIHEHKIGYCGHRQVVVWDERIVRSGTDSSPYPGYSFFEHKEYHVSAMQLDGNKVAVALLDGTGSVDFLEPFNPSPSSSNPYTTTNSSAPTSVLRTFRKLAFDVEKEKKKMEKKDKKDKEKDKKASLIDRLRIGSRATTPADLEAEDKRAAKQANLQAIRSTTGGIPSVGLLTCNSVQFEDRMGLVVSGGGDGFIHIWRLAGSASPFPSSFPPSSVALHPTSYSLLASSSPYAQPQQQYPPTFAYPPSNPYQTPAGSVSFHPPLSTSTSLSSSSVASSSPGVSSSSSSVSPSYQPAPPPTSSTLPVITTQQMPSVQAHSQYTQ